MVKVTITRDDSTIEVSDADLDKNCTWTSIAEMFFNGIKGCGYDYLFDPMDYLYAERDRQLEQKYGGRYES